MIQARTFLLPSAETSYALVLVSLAIIVGIKLSKTDRSAPSKSSGPGSEVYLNRLGRVPLPESLRNLFSAFIEGADISRRSQAVLPALAFFFVAADTLSILLDSEEPMRTSVEGFSRWISAFLDPKSKEYKYPAKKLYATRSRLFNGLLPNPQATEAPLGYAVDGTHVFGGESGSELEIISLPEMMKDLKEAIERVLEVAYSDANVMEHIETRWQMMGGTSNPFSLGVD